MKGLGAVFKRELKVYLMESNTSERNETQISLRPVTNDNWRNVAILKVSEAQREFVAEPSYYLALCCYGNDWRPLAIYLDEQVIGFMMWAIDPADGSCWLGGTFTKSRFAQLLDLGAGEIIPSVASLGYPANQTA